MTIARIEHKIAQSAGGINTVTSGGGVTTGADFIGAVGAHGGSTGSEAFSDSKGNTYSLRTVYNAGGGQTVIGYAYGPPTVGSSHTLTFSNAGNFSALAWGAFSGLLTGADPYDVENGLSASGSATTIVPGNVTPGQNGSLILTGATGFTDPNSINASLTISDHAALFSIGSGVGIGLAWYEQPTAGAISPTWTYSGSDNSRAAAIAAFKPAAGGGGGAQNVTLGQASWVWTGRAADINKKTQLTLSLGSWVWTGAPVTINLRLLLTLALGSWLWTGRAPTVNAKTILALMQAAWLWTGRAATINAKTMLTLAQGAWTWTGRAATIATAGAITMAQAIWTWAGRAPTVDAKTMLTLAQGAWSWAGRAATVNAKAVTTLAQASWVWTGRAATVGTRITITMAQGAWAWAGRAAAFNAKTMLTLARGVWIWGGRAATIVTTGVVARRYIQNQWNKLSIRLGLS